MTRAENSTIRNTPLVRPRAANRKPGSGLPPETGLYGFLMRMIRMPHGSLMRIGRKSAATKEPIMPDLLYFGLGAAFFAGFVAYTLLCERL